MRGGSPPGRGGFGRGGSGFGGPPGGFMRPRYLYFLEIIVVQYEFRNCGTVYSQLSR